MSKRINEVNEETDPKRQKTVEDNKSDADSPLLYFEDHSSFQYQHPGNVENINLISKYSPDKTLTLNGLNNVHENGTDNKLMELNNDEIGFPDIDCIPKLGAVTDIKNECENLFKYSDENPNQLDSIPIDIIPFDSLNTVIDNGAQIKNTLTGSVHQDLKHEMEEVDKIFETDSTQLKEEVKPITNVDPDMTKCIEVMNPTQNIKHFVDLDLDKSHVCSIKVELNIQNPVDRLTNDSPIEDNFQNISTDLNLSVEKAKEIFLNENLSTESPIENKIPLNSEIISQITEIDNLQDNYLNCPDTLTSKVVDSNEANNEQSADNSTNLDVNTTNNSNTESQPNKRRTRTRKSLEQKDESVVKSYKLRSSLTKLDISLDNNSCPIKESQSNHPEVKTSSQKRKSTQLESNEGNKIQRRVSARIEKLTLTKLEKLMSSESVHASSKIEKSTPKASKQIKKEIHKLTSHDVNDPGNWPDQIPDNLKLKLIKNGPVQIDNIWFPRDNRQKCFSASSYLIKTNDGRKFRRNWLVYSIVKDAAFCFPCRIFAPESQSTLANSGCRNWKKLTSRVNSHDLSIKHIESVEQWAAVSIQNDFNNISTLTSDEALKLAERLSQFASTKENKLYLTAKQLEWELQRLNNPSG